jgi:hypothetical protein
MSDFDLAVDGSPDGRMRISVCWDDDREPSWLPSIMRIGEEHLLRIACAAVKAAPDAERDAIGLYWPSKASAVKALAAAKKAMK